MALKLKQALLVALICMLAVPIAKGGELKLRTKSDWVDNTYSLTRLVSATLKQNGVLTMYAAVEIKLEPKWKTYWRSPGLTGLPPRFDFTGSTNLKTAQVLFPLPSIYEDPAGKTVGYKHRVLFPIKLEPKVQGEPIRLKVKFQYGVCKELCVPVSGQTDVLSMANGSSFFAKSKMRRAIGKVPVKLALGLINKQPYKLITTAPKPVDQRRVIFSVQTDTPARQVELFVELKNGAYVPPAKKTKTDTGALFEVTMPNNDEKIELSHFVCTIRVNQLLHERPCVAS